MSFPHAFYLRSFDSDADVTDGFIVNNCILLFYVLLQGQCNNSKDTGH